MSFPWRAAGVLLLLPGFLPADPPARDRHGDPLPPGAVARLGTERFRHPGRVYSLDFAPDGKTLASVGSDRTVCLWEASTGRLIRKWTAAKSPVGYVGFAPDGGSLVTMEEEPRQLSVWSPEGKLRFQHASNPEVFPVYSGDSKELACRGDGKKIHILDATTGKEKRNFETRQEPTILALSPDGKLLALGDPRGHVRLYDTEAGKQLRTYEPDEVSVTALTFLADGKELATGSGRGLVCIWETATEHQRLQISEEPNVVMGLRSVKAGAELLVLRGHGVVHAHDTRTGKLLETLGERVAADDPPLALSADGRCRAHAVLSRIGVRDLTTDTFVPVAGQLAPFTGAAWSPDGKLAGVTTEKEAIHLWDPFGPLETVVRTVTPAGGSAFEATFSGDGKWLVSGGDKSPLVIWDAATGKQVREITLEMTSSRPIAFAPFSRLLAVLTEQGILFLDAETGKERWSLNGPDLGNFLQFTADGRAFVAMRHNQLHFWEVNTGKERQRVELTDARIDKLLLLTVSPDSLLVATGESTGDIQLVDLETGKLLRRLRGAGEIQLLAFSPGSQLLASAAERTVQLWDVKTGSELCQLTAHGETITGLAFSPDGKHLLTASRDSTALVWDVPKTLAHSPQPAPPVRRAIADLWTDLASPDGIKAFAAVRELAARPAESVPFLKQRVRPAVRPEGAVFTRLLADLDSDQFETRDRAARELRALDRQAEATLRKALAGKPTPEAHRSIEEILAHLETMPDSDRMREARAVEALERSRHADALPLLETLATGAPEARLTQEARLALERLKRRASLPR
jgi:WD40 repeat protein